MTTTSIIMSALTLASTGAELPEWGGVRVPESLIENPLVQEWNTPYATPPFDKIELADYEPAFDFAIAVNRAEIETIVNNPEPATFENTIVAMERSGELLGRISGVFFNLLSADTSNQMQDIAMRISPKLTELGNDISLNPELFARVKAVYENKKLKLLDDTYKSFARSGAALSEADKELYRQYTTELSQLTLQFSQNSLDATNAFTYNITDPALVEELPDFVKEGMAAEAKARGEQGWTVTLQAPSYGPFMTYSSQRDIKEKLYREYNSRSLGGKYDNTANIKRITELRLKIANLLGYKCYADYVLEDRMAETSKAVNKFLDELLRETKEYAHKDYRTVADLMPWDWGYYNQKYTEEKYAISDELVKPYLKLENVKEGVFMLANRLYGLTFTPNREIAVYHPDVTAYDVKDADGKMLAVLYLDFFPRESKNAGA